MAASQEQVKQPRQQADDPDRYVIGRVGDLPEGSRVIVNIRGWSIGVFNVRGRYHAMLNRCPHKDGPLCQGNVVDWVVSEKPGEVSLDPARTFIACPWHGYEYDMETGRSWCPEDGRVRNFPTEVDPGSTVESELADGTVAAPTERAPYNPVTHRADETYTAEVVPLEVEEDYLVLSVAGLRQRGVAPHGS